MIPMQHAGKALTRALALLLALGSAARAELRIRFVDIGQGDAALVRTPGGKGWLVDAGPSSKSGEAILAAMAAEGLDRLEGILVTHPHLDHFGGISRLLDKVPVGRILYNLDLDAPMYRRMVAKAAEKGVPYQRVKKGALAWDPALEARVVAARDPRDMAFALAGLSTRTSLDPRVALMALERQCGVELFGIDVNDYSVVVRLDYAGFGILLTGDATHRVEEELVAAGTDLDVELLKVAHHGSRYSSTRDFLDAVTPEDAVIQVGNPNDYGHPHAPALARLKEVDARVSRNDQEGSLLLVVDDDGSASLGGVE